MINSKCILLIIIIRTLHFTSFTQMQMTEVKNLVQGSDIIVTGKVIQKVSGWNKSKTRIFTNSTVIVDEYLKGLNSQKIIEVKTPGGEVGEVGELYSHMPRFEN